jgi:hypothetical protein
MGWEPTTKPIYRMPFGFGPTAGPRQGPDGKPFSWVDSPVKLTVATSFLTDPDKLAALLPPRFELAGEPVVTAEFHVLSELEWLAGRGYSMLQVKFPTAFRGDRDMACGSFLCVLWENLADPVLSGREELGFAKLWCDLPPPRIFQNRVTCVASWLSHQFFEMELFDLAPADGVAVPRPGMTGLQGDGILHYKYIPETQHWGEAAVAHACLSPSVKSARLERLSIGQGNVTFLPTTWQQMPTQFHVVNVLAGLPQLEQREAWVSSIRGASDLSEQLQLI